MPFNKDYWTPARRDEAKRRMQNRWRLLPDKVRDKLAAQQSERMTDWWTADRREARSQKLKDYWEQHPWDALSPEEQEIKAQGHYLREPDCNKHPNCIERRIQK